MNSRQQQSSPELAGLSHEELREVMYSRLQGYPSIGPVADLRAGPEPFEWLSEQFQHADAGLQHRMTSVLRGFLDELTNTERWPEGSRCALLDLLQDCGETLIDDLFRLIRQQDLLGVEGLGADAHAGLLKCLISNGHHVTAEFWLEQFELLGPPYGALVFSGLVDHGVELAMSHLPQLSSDREAKQRIRWLFPHLKDRYGVQAVTAALDAQRERLPNETYLLYRGDLVVPVVRDITTPEAELTDSGGQRPASERSGPISAKVDTPAPRTWADLQGLVQRAKQRPRTTPLEFSGLFAV